MTEKKVYFEALKDLFTPVTLADTEEKLLILVFFEFQGCIFHVKLKLFKTLSGKINVLCLNTFLIEAALSASVFPCPVIK